MWTVISFILSLCITIDGDEGYFLDNLLTFFTSFLALTAPAWLYWISFWIWGKTLHRLVKKISCQLVERLAVLSKNKLSLIRRLSYVIILILSMLIAGSLSRTVVKNFFENRKITTKLLELGATKDEIENLETKIKNIKGNFESLWNEKDFRSMMLRNAVLSINKNTPIKIDDLVYLIESHTDGDRALFYKYRVDMTYDEGKKILNKYKDASYQGRKEYWCHDDRAAEFRKMESVIVYEYFSQDMLAIESYLFDIGIECRDLKIEKAVNNFIWKNNRAYR